MGEKPIVDGSIMGATAAGAWLRNAHPEEAIVSAVGEVVDAADGGVYVYGRKIPHPGAE